MPPRRELKNIEELDNTSSMINCRYEDDFVIINPEKKEPDPLTQSLFEEIKSTVSDSLENIYFPSQDETKVLDSYNNDGNQQTDLSPPSPTPNHVLTLSNCSNKSRTSTISSSNSSVVGMYNSIYKPQTDNKNMVQDRKVVDRRKELEEKHKDNIKYLVISGVVAVTSFTAMSLLKRNN